MDCVSLGTREPGDLRGHVTAALAPVVAAGVVVRIEEQRRGDLHFLTCRVDGDAGRSGAARPFRQAVAAAVSAWIVETHEPRLLLRLVASRYAYFNEREREGIMTFAQRQLALSLGGGEADAPVPAAQVRPPRGRAEQTAGGDRPDAGARAERRARILAQVAEYLERNDSMVLDGFVAFRLKDYMEELAIAVDRAVDDFLLEREYREFIGLLRHFVTNRSDRPAVADCIVAADGHFALEDGQGRPLGGEVLVDLAAGAQSGDVAPEDLLVSALITVAPRQVRLHVPEGPAPALSSDAVDSLREVFFGQVEICRGCRRCAGRPPRRHPPLATAPASGPAARP